jgi:hypothetical protein
LAVVQKLAPFADHSPAPEHGSHAAPLDEKRPASHAKHAPDAALKAVPGEHALQVDDPGSLVAAVHGSHSFAAPTENVLRGQASSPVRFANGL